MEQGEGEEENDKEYFPEEDYFSGLWMGAAE